MENQADEGISFSSKGSTMSGWGRRKMTENDKRTAIWRQLYLSRAKLKAVSRTSALIAGFAMIAMVEVQLDATVKYPQGLLIAFSFVTTCLVSVHLFALMISTCLLPNIEAISNIHNLNAAKYSPHIKMRTYIEVSWILSTGIGLVLFLVEIALLIWLKFVGISEAQTGQMLQAGNGTATEQQRHNANTAAWAATGVLIPVILLFAAFALKFYSALAKHKYGMFNSVMKEINELELREDEMSYRLRQTISGNREHQPVSRLQSGLSDCGPHLRINGHSTEQEHEKTESFVIDIEDNGNSKSSSAIDILCHKNED